MTYSRMRKHTTIGACAFHFRVRDGIGWFHAAMFTRERVEGRRLSGIHRDVVLPTAALTLSWGTCDVTVGLVLNACRGVKAT